MENPPFSIRPSIDDSIGGHPLPLSVQQQQYSSTPWTGRSTTTEPTKTQNKPKYLTENDRLLIFQLAIKASDSYDRVPRKRFWDKVASSFESATGKRHLTIGRAVDNIVKARRKVLAEENTCKEDNATSLTNAIDQWITIIDERKALKVVRKEAQGTRDNEIQASIYWHDDQIKLWRDKTELSLAPLGRKRRRDFDDSDNRGNSGRGSSGRGSSGRGNSENGRSEAAGDETASDGIDSDEAGSANTTSVGTPISQSSYRRKRRRIGTSEEGSPSRDISRQIRRLIDIVEARVTENVFGQVQGFNEKLRGVEVLVSKILSILASEAGGIPNPGKD